MIIYIFINLIFLEIGIVSSWWSQSQIRSLMNGKCLDIAGGVNSQGTNIQMYECHNGSPQSWFYDILTKEIKNMNPSGIEYCLDLEGGNNADGTNIRIWKCNGENAQKWLLNNDNTISNINGGCLDIFAFNNDNGANVNIWTCNADAKNQQWILTSEIKSIMHGKCLDVLDSKTDPATNVQMYHCNGGNAQKWYYNKLTKEIKNINPNGDDLCLDLENGNTANGTNIRMWTCNNGNAQKWLLNQDETIENINGGCLDIFAFKLDDYADVKLWTCNADAVNQRWFGTFIPMKSPQELIIRKTSEYDWIYDDHDTGADKDGSFWKPKLYSTEAFISFINVLSHNGPSNDESSIVIMRYPLDALANPISYEWIWDDSGSGGSHDIIIYRPIAPPGYICYGDYLVIDDDKSVNDGYKCIHSRYVHFDNELMAEIQTLYWDDRGSGADDNVQIIKISTNDMYPYQYYRSHNLYDQFINYPYGPFELKPIEATDYVTIRSVMNGKCLDVAGGKNIGGTNVQMFECNNNPPAQNWKYIPSTQEFQTIYGKCLEIEGGINVEGANIQIMDCKGIDAQKWLIKPDHTIENINGRCLDIYNYDNNNGANIKLYGCHGDRNQLWSGGDIFGAQDVKKFAVKRFAPILKFDRDAEDYGYPMNPQTYINNNCMNSFDLDKCENNDLDVISNPTYYRILSANITNGNLDIVYWWFYGYQHKCINLPFGDDGSHAGDWERIVVHINNWDINSVTFAQHGGYYTPSSIERSEHHPIVYVGKLSHGSYYDDRNDVGGGCGYFYDWRNPGPSLDTKNNLINLEESSENWIKNGIHICCSNPLTDKTNLNGCDDCGCNWQSCNTDNDLRLNLGKCIAC